MGTSSTSDRYAQLKNHIEKLKRHLSQQHDNNGKDMPIQQYIISKYYGNDIRHNDNTCVWWNDARELHSLLSGVLDTVNRELPFGAKVGKLIAYCNANMSQQQIDMVEDMDTGQILNMCRQDLISRLLRQRTQMVDRGRKETKSNGNGGRKIIMKIIVVGPVQAGKSSCIQKYVRNEFQSVYRTTIGVDFFLKEIRDYRPPLWSSSQRNDREESNGLMDRVEVPAHHINIHLWDIAGQERFDKMTRSFYQEAIGAVVVADCTSQLSIQEALRWKKDIDEKVCVHDPQTGKEVPIPCIFFLNKDDLLDDDDDDERDSDSTDSFDTVRVPHNLVRQMDEIRTKYGFIRWIPTSAKTGHNIEAGIMALIDHIFQQGLLNLPTSPVNEDAIRLHGSGAQRALTYMDESGQIRTCRPRSSSSTDGLYSDSDDESNRSGNDGGRSRCCG